MTRVLAARLDSAGDVLVTEPALRAIAADPRVEALTLLCGPQGRAAAELLPEPDALLSWASPWTLAPAPPATSAHLAELRDAVAAGGYDAAVVFTSFHQSPLPLALVLRTAGIAHITGASTDYPGSLLDVRLRPGEDFPEDQPEVERALRIAAAAGFGLPAGDAGRMRIADPSGAFFGTPAAAAAGLRPDEPYLVLHPGAAAPARMWPPERSRAAVELLTRRGWTVAVTGGPAERELTAAVAGAHGIDLGGRCDLRGTADLLARASALVSGNTGPAHLAAAVGTPVVSLFSPVVPAIRWAPYGVPVELLGDQTAPCRGTRARECPVPGHPCLASVAPEAVAEAVRRIVDRTRSCA
ncbi:MULTISPECIES: glycosyltransferase family 9 protein [Brevibacterium]|uniref:Glycosyltransferase family 9 protein n=1 Tax=Brevibacterium salitolerans TaxID=1403566 RepID=A0ABP5HYL7_9MICO|nr:glycosyltransferase family 9 protein [Brevibacterium sp.]